MTMVMAWIQTYWKELLFGLFWGMQALFLIILMVIAHRTAVIKKKLNQIVSKVGGYLTAVMQEEDEQPQEEMKAVPLQRHVEEEESRLISSVLREMFP